MRRGLSLLSCQRKLASRAASFVTGYHLARYARGWHDITLFFMFLIFSLNVYAHPDDLREKIHIKADSQELNYNTGINSYSGNVQIDQGTTHLNAARVVTKNNNQHKIQEAIAYGDKELAKYTTIPKTGDAVMQAEAKIIKFYPLKATIVMEGNVIVTQGENSFHGPTIIYNIKEQTVSVPASETGGATITIEPDNI